MPALPFKPVLLWTDALVFVLLAAVIAFAWQVRRREHLRQPWVKVSRSRLGMVSAVLLCVFVAIGLLDSLHFRPRLSADAADGRANYAVETMSVFDLMVTGLRTRPETTYSAPLATHLYAKETVEGPDGRQIRVYPRLKYGGAHLQDPERDWAPDVLRRAVAGVAAAALLWNLVLAGAIAWLAARRGQGFRATWQTVWRGQTDVPWREMLATAGVLLLLFGPAAMLAAKYHLLGTDKVGQDVFYLALKSIRTGLVIGTLTTLVMLPLALLLGIMAGYFRGWIDDVIQYVYTTLNSIPGVLLIAAAVLMTQAYMDSRPGLFDTVQQRQDLRLLFLCLILGMTSWTGLCRLLRGEALKLREMEYIQAAQAFGVADLRIITRHILPNVMHIVLISVVMDFSGLVLAEAVLSYVGVGVDPTMISFGTMINAARLEMAREPMVWWSLAAAFVFMLMLVLSANLFADAVRDAFDPRIGGRTGRLGFLARFKTAGGA
ncbi:MAG TPA: ABC transporter permease [Burkholderiales bacterium]|nr:ABC transporter permease [Burkholderiales bacterium]